MPGSERSGPGGDGCLSAVRPSSPSPICGAGTPAYARLATGFDIGVATVFRYIREVINVLAALAPTLTEAMKTIRTKAFVILDGTLLPIDRIAADTPYC